MGRTNVRHGQDREHPKKEPRPYVNHYHFHILDADWGHITIKMSGHPPFGAQVMLNGHQYVACQSRKEKLEFSKEGNCFIHTPDAAGLARVADTLSEPRTTGWLREVCERWIYSTCLLFALDVEEQKRSAFEYQYSIYQIEYSRNFLFQSRAAMEQIFQSLIDRTRAPLGLDRVKTIFGNRKRPCRRKLREGRYGVVVETPAYDLTVFKVHYGKLSTPKANASSASKSSCTTLKNCPAGGPCRISPSWWEYCGECWNDS